MPMLRSNEIFLVSLTQEAEKNQSKYCLSAMISSRHIILVAYSI